MLVLSDSQRLSISAFAIHRHGALNARPNGFAFSSGGKGMLSADYLSPPSRLPHSRVSSAGVVALIWVSSKLDFGVLELSILIHSPLKPIRTTSNPPLLLHPSILT